MLQSAMDDLKCPKCLIRQSNDLNSLLNSNEPLVKFAHSIKCPHYLQLFQLQLDTRCINCLNDLYRTVSQKQQIKCYTCQTFLKKSDYTEQTIEEYQFDRDFKIRDKIMKIYNKKRIDFPSLDQYYQYLEDVEDKIQKLIDGEEVERIDKEILEYKKRNKDQISIANLKKEEQLKALQLMIKIENQKLNPFSYRDNLDSLELEKAKQLITGFKLDDIDYLGETQAQIDDQVQMLIDQQSAQNPSGQNQQQQPKFIEPYLYTLYRTEMPREIEYQKMPSTNLELQRKAGGGLMRLPRTETYKLANLHNERAAKIFKSGLF
ncbi:menage a trois 1 [Stylonychia lemnae]|uniref:Menage a trois 1 n=1 Tax=Stylonychia lemnae TaxID=5949 RepID=A0A077ZS53_STYLE|nr:menage a trois 1 [Stylonychia lemnae]|eukprot:CDW72314.1 menage a trois 1 [Stylonychia lemnae]